MSQKWIFLFIEKYHYIRRLVEIILYKEQWQWVEGHEHNYQISTHGRVKSYKGAGNKNKLMKTFYNKAGYERVTLYRKGKKKHWLVHVLVAKAFVANDDVINNDQVDHINHMRDDNRAINLRWSNHAENQRNRRDRLWKSNMFQ